MSVLKYTPLACEAQPRMGVTCHLSGKDTDALGHWDVPRPPLSL